jgi:hypothetical protein
MKEDVETVTKNCKNTPPTGIQDPNSGKLRHQEGPSPQGMKIFFLVTVMFVETLDTKQFIIKFMK